TYIYIFAICTQNSGSKKAEFNARHSHIFFTLGYCSNRVLVFIILSFVQAVSSGCSIDYIQLPGNSSQPAMIDQTSLTRLYIQWVGSAFYNLLHQSSSVSQSM
ncbi:hypothetical protein TorRG33x02_127180, partial [Trema orientale]